MEVSRYYGEVFSSFDIGNYAELAEKIRRVPSRFEEARTAALDRYNLRTNVNEHLARLGHSSTGAPGG